MCVLIIHIAHVDLNGHRGTAESLWPHVLPFRKFIGQHDEAFADSQLGVTDATIRHVKTQAGLRFEDSLVVGNSLTGALQSIAGSFEQQCRRRL